VIGYLYVSLYVVYRSPIETHSYDRLFVFYVSMYVFCWLPTETCSCDRLFLCYVVCVVLVSNKMCSDTLSYVCVVLGSNKDI